MENKKLTWEQVDEYLTKHNDKKAVIVFKQNKNWKKEHYSLDELSYIVSGRDKWFNPWSLGSSIFGYNLAGTERGVRLDWYMFDENKEYRWEVDYCYILED